MKAKKVTSYKKVPIYQCKNKYFAEVDNENVIKDSIEEVKDEVDKIFNDNASNEHAQLTQADFSEDSKKIKFNNNIVFIGRFEDTDKFGPFGISKDSICTISKVGNDKLHINYKGINFIATKSGSAGITYTKFIKNKDNLFTVISDNDQNFSEKPYIVYKLGKVNGKTELSLVNTNDGDELEEKNILKAFAKEKDAMDYMDKLKKKYPDKYFWEDYLNNFSQAYKVADLPFTFLKRKQMGVYTIFDCDDCQIKIKTDTLDKNNSLVKVKNFSEDLYNAKLGNTWLVDNGDYIGFEDNNKPKVALPLQDLMKKCSQMKDVSLDNIEYVKVANFADNDNWQDKFVSNLNVEIDKQGLGDKLTVTIDNTGNIVLANVETEDELVITDETEPSEYQKFLTDNGLVLDENNIENFSQINFGLGNWLEKMAVKGLKNIASKGQQKALMAVYLGYAQNRYEQALNAIQAAIDVAPTGIVQGHLRRMLLNGEMPKGLSKFTNCPSYKGLEEYKQVIEKVAGKLNNDAAVQAYKNAKDLDDKMQEMIKQGKELANDANKENVENKSDVKDLGQETSKAINEYMQELAEFKKNDKFNKVFNGDKLRNAFIKEAKKVGWSKEDAETTFESNDAKSTVMKLRVMTNNGNGNNKKLNELYKKLSNALSAAEKAKGTVDKKEDKETREDKPEMVNSSYKGFSEELNNITSQFTTEFFAEKVRDSEFGICYQDKFGSLWSADPDTNKDATLLWQSKDGKEVPTTDNSDDAIMDESEMDDTLGMESEEDNGGDDDFDFGDEESSEESGDDLDFGDEESEESDDLGFSEDEDEDFDFGDEESEGEDEFDFEDEETEESTTEGNPDMQKALDVLNSMYDKLYELAKNK